MLAHLFVANFTLVEQQELNFRDGLTVLTGETGAGKSILLDALGLALGERADASKVRPGANQAEVCASFDINALPRVKTWLEEAELGSDECILRRIVTSEGRSRAQINGRPVTQTQLRALAEQLVDIHSQNEHQALLVNTKQRAMLDAYGQQGELLQSVKEAYKHWAETSERLTDIRTRTDEINARFQLLRYQAQELDQLALQDGELTNLEERQKHLAHAEQIQQACRQSAEACIGMEESIGSQLHRVIALLTKLPHLNERMLNAKNMLQEAKIQVQEAGHELELEAAEDNLAAELPEIEARLSAIYDIARKHRVAPEELFELHQNVQTELQSLQSGDAQQAELEKATQAALARYSQAAANLTKARTKFAKALAKAVNQHLQNLAMANARFEVALTANTDPSSHGAESVEYLISTVPGQPPQPLSKIASGGELSRVSLAIQVANANTTITPTLVFDEVDVGIGGATGDVVGRMLRALGGNSQILCVTHLAQVASKAHHHLTVEKVLHKKSANTVIRSLTDEDRVLEVARMMGGAIDSEQSLAHAREMLTVE